MTVGHKRPGLVHRDESCTCSGVEGSAGKFNRPLASGSPALGVQFIRRVPLNIKIEMVEPEIIFFLMYSVIL